MSGWKARWSQGWISIQPWSPHPAPSPDGRGDLPYFVLTLDPNPGSVNLLHVILNLIQDRPVRRFASDDREKAFLALATPTFGGFLLNGNRVSSPYERILNQVQDDNLRLVARY